MIIGLETFRELEKRLYTGEALEVKMHGKRLNEITSYHGKRKANISKLIDFM